MAYADYSDGKPNSEVADDLIIGAVLGGVGIVSPPIYGLFSGVGQVIYDQFNSVHRTVNDNVNSVWNPDMSMTATMILVGVAIMIAQTVIVKYLEKSLPYVHRLWGRPVHLETMLENRAVLFTYDGKKNHRKFL